MAGAMRYLTLGEYAEAQRIAGNEWANAMLAAVDAQELVDRCETLDDEIRSALEESGCVTAPYNYDTLEVVKAVCSQNEQVATFLDEQEDKWWHSDSRDESDHQARIRDGVGALEAIRCKYEDIEECLHDLGVLDGSDDTDIPALLRLLIG